MLLVLDATTGQNAVNQASEFSKATGITGIVLTKLDGTAKGGVVLAIRDGLGIPVKYVGVGEQIDDLQPFDPESFAKALFVKVGPKHIHKNKFRICTLPDQKIAQSLFPTGPQDQIGIGLTTGK